MWYYESMITIDDINRLYGGKETQERLINSAAKACSNAQSDWARTSGLVYFLNYVKSLVERTYIINIYTRNNYERILFA